MRNRTDTRYLYQGFLSTVRSYFFYSPIYTFVNNNSYAGEKNLRTTVRIVSVLSSNVALEGLYLDQFQKVNTSDILIIIL